jgi:hypothetical protein
MTTLEYFKLVERLENEKIYTLHEVVEEGRVQGLLAKTKHQEKAMARAVEALRVRARRNNLKVDKFVNDSKYIHRGYFGWRIKLTYKPSFFSEVAYQTLIQLAVKMDGSYPGPDLEIDHQDLAASTRIVAEIKKRAFEETKVLALAEARAEARAELRRVHWLRMSLAFVGMVAMIIAGISLHLRAKPAWSPNLRPVSLVATDFADINAVFELDEPLLIVAYHAFGLGDWLSIKGREGYLVQIKRDEVVLETSYGLEAFPLPPLYVLGALERDRENVVVYPAPENKQLLEAVYTFTGKPLDRVFVGSISGTANFPDYDAFIEAATSWDYHIFYSSQIIWTLELDEMVDRFTRTFGLPIQVSPCSPSRQLTFIKPQLETLMEIKEKCDE